MSSIPCDNLFTLYVILKLHLYYQEYTHVVYFLSGSVGLHSLHLFWLLWSLTPWPLVRIPTYKTIFSCIFICCVSSMCSPLYDTIVQWNVVLRFGGFNWQSTQGISLLHPLRYLATWLLMFLNCRPEHILQILLKNLAWWGIGGTIGRALGWHAPKSFMLGVSAPTQLTAAGTWFRHSWSPDQWRGNLAWLVIHFKSTPASKQIKLKTLSP